MRVGEEMTFEGIDDYIVRGPEGEFFGRFKTRPTPDQIPLHAIVEKERPGAFIVDPETGQLVRSV